MQPIIMHPIDLLKARKLRAEALKTARTEAGINKNTMATNMGISRRTLDNIENNHLFWGVDVEIMYLHHLGMASFQPVYGEENGKRVVTKMVLIPTEK